jgi:pyruvate,water dikinase
MPEEKSEKKEVAKVDFIAWFSELNKGSGNIAGGKGANLGEMYNLKIPVPPGFVVTAQAYEYFIKKAGLDEKIKTLLQSIEYENTEQLNKVTTEIRNLIEAGEIPKEMQEEIIEAYENLDVDKSHINGKSALDVLKTTPESLFVAVRSSATTEDLAEASFAGQQETFLNVKGKFELLKYIKKCFSSLFTPRATYYRNKKGFKHEGAFLAVIVQKMVDAEKSGVIFSKDPSQKRDDVIIESVYGLGEGVVSGKITPDRFVISKELEILERTIGDKKIAITRDSGGKKEIVKLKEEISKRQSLKDYEVKKLAEIAIKLENHYQKAQDIEFAIEGENIYIVQTRPITTLEKRFEGGSGKELQGEVVLTGLAASPGIGSGKVKIVKDLADLKKIIQGDVLVTGMTDPDMVVSMQKSAAIVTDEGGLTAHAAIVSREMGIPAVVGTQEATTKLKEGEVVTVDGFTGKIYKGKVAETVQKEVLPVTTETKTEIKINVDLPSFAERAAKTRVKKVGLLRTEGIIAEGGKHPAYFLQKNQMQDYEEIIFKGVRKIAQYFEEIWVRTSDIRSDEFQDLEGAPKEIEVNPMLGMHGIRYGIKNPEILKAELRALKRVSDDGKKIGLLLPLVISVDEVKKVKEFVKELGFTEAKVGVMIETPAAVQIIRELCEEGIDFASFGTNDLTQFILAVDRGNEQVQHLYDEMNPAILYQLEFVLRACNRSNVETSICGQAGSKKEMVKFLVERGIDSISVNADMASEIAKYVSELETGKKPGEPKQEGPKEDFVKPQNIQPEAEQTPIQEPEPEKAPLQEPEPAPAEEPKQEEAPEPEPAPAETPTETPQEKPEQEPTPTETPEKEEIETPKEPEEELPVIPGAEKLQKDEEEDSKEEVLDIF